MIARLLQGPKPPGLLECECGSRTTITTITEGAKLKEGRLVGGRTVLKFLCAHCYARGKVSFMQAEPAQPKG